MRRAIVGLAATAFALLALTGPASAAPEVTHFMFSGPFANVLSITVSATSETITVVNVEANQGQGTVLRIDQEITQFDANRNITGYTETNVYVTSGFSFLQTGLERASLTASGVPAKTCSFDANDNQIGCSSTTMNASLTWAGQGEVQVGVQNNHFKGEGFNVTEHFVGKVRIATATGTVGDLTLTATTAESADLGTNKEGTTEVCTGNSC
jgi:hypothetical protein